MIGRVECIAGPCCCLGSFVGDGRRLLVLLPLGVVVAVAASFAGCLGGLHSVVLGPVAFVAVGVVVDAVAVAGAVADVAPSAFAQAARASVASGMPAGFRSVAAADAAGFAVVAATDAAGIVGCFGGHARWLAIEKFAVA